MFAHRILIPFLGLLTAISGVSVAHAEYSKSPFRHHHSYGRHDKSIYSGDSLTTSILRLGTFSGGITAFRERRNGNYFAVEGGAFSRPGAGGLTKPRIIHVDKARSDASCSYEAGVCVIRP